MDSKIKELRELRRLADELQAEIDGEPFPQKRTQKVEEKRNDPAPISSPV